MKFDYKNRPQSEGRVIHEKCGKPMLGIEESLNGFWTWDKPLEEIFTHTFCACEDEQKMKSLNEIRDSGADRQAFQADDEAHKTEIRNDYCAGFDAAVAHMQAEIERLKAENDIRNTLAGSLSLMKERDELKAQLAKLIEALEAIAMPIQDTINTTEVERSMAACATRVLAELSKARGE